MREEVRQGCEPQEVRIIGDYLESCYCRQHKAADSGVHWQGVVGTGYCCDIGWVTSVLGPHQWGSCPNLPLPLWFYANFLIPL